MTEPSPTLSQIYYVVLPLLLRAGQILMARQREVVGLPARTRHERGQQIEQEVRDFLHRTLLQLFPTHQVFEGDVVRRAAAPTGWQWVTTPLEGGRYYFRGLPFYTTSLALRHDGELVLGIVVEPVSQTAFHALKGEGAFCNSQPIAVSDERDLTNACVYLVAPKPSAVEAMVRKHAAVEEALRRSGSRIADFGVGSLGLCYLAAGAFDGFVGFREEGALANLLAGFIIAREAGATVMDGEGKALRATSASNTILVTTPSLGRPLLLLVNHR